MWDSVQPCLPVLPTIPDRGVANAKAVDYNERLAAMGVAGFYSPDRVEGYKEALNISGIGVMGYITIPKINVELPIYHGTSEGVLQIAVGHLEGSSLPIGGEGTHCVLSGHRGLPSANLFTHLDKLDVGDIFTITVLDKVLTYEVDQIRIVEPGEVGELQKVEGKDYCTLLTCTPYGINTHRLLVRGQRVANIEDGTQLYVIADAYKMDTKTVTIIMAIPLTILICTYKTCPAFCGAGFQSILELPYAGTKIEKYGRNC